MAGEKNTLVKIAVIALVVLIVDVIAGYFILQFAIPRIYQTGEASPRGADKKAQEQLPSIQKALAPINLNPAGSSGEILSTEIVLESRDQAVIDEATAREAQIQDVIITYLSFKSVADLNDIAKRDQFKKEMLDKLNSLLKAGKLSGLYTKSWIIQFE